MHKEKVKIRSSSLRWQLVVMEHMYTLLSAYTICAYHTRKRPAVLTPGVNQPTITNIIDYQH
jgi:hypothetical protein